jgi:hypothetical protein
MAFCRCNGDNEIVAQNGEKCMTSYATSATVQAQGEVHVAGVPFAPGTEVEITISPRQADGDKLPGVDSNIAAARDQMRELFQTIKGFRNSPKIPREELHGRGSLR